MARVTGWTAHIMEQLADNRLIRPLSQYTGAGERRVVPLAQRLELDAVRRLLFIDFEGLAVASAADVDAIEHEDARVRPALARLASVLSRSARSAARPADSSTA